MLVISNVKTNTKYFATNEVNEKINKSCTVLDVFKGAQEAFNGVLSCDVAQQAKELFCKRKTTLMHWMNPHISYSKLKAYVNAAWNFMPDSEKLFYISQVGLHHT